MLVTIELKNLIIAKAEQFICDNLDGRLAPFKAFFTHDGAVKFPYSELEIELAMQCAVEACSKAVPKERGRIIYIAGAGHGISLIKEQTEVFAAAHKFLEPLRDEAINFSFKTMQEALKANPEMAHYLVEKDGIRVEYIKIHPLIAAVDMALKEIGPKYGYTVITENTLTPADKGCEDRMREQIIDYSEKYDVAIVGAALMPNEVEAGASTTFARNINYLISVVPDVLIFDSSGNTLLHKENEYIERMDVENVVEWLKACKVTPSSMRYRSDNSPNR